MALAVALDTNRYVDWCRGQVPATEVIAAARRIVMPFIVLGELRGGFRLGTKARQNEQVLSRFLQSPRVEVVYADEGTTHFYAGLYAELCRIGTPIPTNDIWIAALTIQHDLVLFARDKHFDHVPRLARI